MMLVVCSSIYFLALAMCQIELDSKSKHDIIKKISVYKKIPALEYLGCGYDILYGNPLIDPEVLVDPGYREPIISYSVVQKQSNHIKRMAFAKISGAWIRPLIACKRSNQRTVVNSMTDYINAISVDGEASLSPGTDEAKFSLSANYEQSNEALNFKKNRLYIDRSYCFLLEAGLPIHSNWRFRKSFIVAAKKLKTNLKDAFKRCNTIKFTIDPRHPDCKSTIKPWIDLFKQFGTHFSYNIKIGGKVTDVTQESAKDKKEKKAKSGGLSAEGSIKSGSYDLNGKVGVGLENSSENSKGERLSYKYTNVLGGMAIGNIENETEYIKWIKSIYKYPMPIRSQFAPISMLFKNEKLKETYDDALAFYLALSLPIIVIYINKQMERVLEYLNVCKYRPQIV